MWTPFFLGGMANLDPSGRIAAAHPAFVTMGGAIGPMIMGYISDYGGFSLVGWVAMLTILISIPMVVIGTKAADQKI
jgi:fucose permease